MVRTAAPSPASRANRVVRSPRIAARRRAVRAEQVRRRRRIVIGVILLIGLGIGAWMLVRSSVFSLQKIDVVGATVLPQQTVIDASGLHLGQNAMKIDVADVAARVRALPGVADVRVEREGSLGIRITITERVASIEVKSGDTIWYLDRTGIQIDAGHQGTKPLPVIQIPASESFASVSTEEELGVLSIWKQMGAAMRRETSWFSYREDGTLTFRLDAALIIFGTTDQAPAKLQAIALVSARVARDHRRLVQLDVRAPDRPAARVV